MTASILKRRSRARRQPLIGEDAEVEQERRDRVLPLCINPRLAEAAHHDHAQHVAPGWIDLFLDLAVVATLNVFSSAHEIDDGASLATFASYIVLLLFQWQSIVNYDIRYQTNDWAHRFAKLAQLSVFAFICAFGDQFDITQIHRVDFAPEDTSTERVSNLRSAKAWSGIVIAFAAGRLLLAIQYVLIILGRKKRPTVALTATLAATCATGLIWFGLYFYQGQSAGSDALRLTLCFGAIVVEMLVSIVVAAVESPLPAQIQLLCERQALMGLIVLGEGVIGILGTFSTIVAGIGFKRIAYAFCFCAIILVYLLWYLSYAAFNVRAPMTGLRAQIWAVLHLPLFLCTLLLLESSASSLVYHNLEAALNYWADSFSIFLSSIYDTASTGFDRRQLQKFSDDLALIGLSYANANNTFSAIALNDTEELDATAYRYFGQILYLTWSQYNTEISENTQHLFDSYYSDFDSTPGDTTETNTQTFNELIGGLLEGVMHSSIYLAPCAGGVLLTTAVLSLLQRIPPDHIGWLSLVPRSLLGLGLALLALLDIGDKHVHVRDDGGGNSSAEVNLPVYRWLMTNWLLPSVVLVLLLVCVAEYAILLWAMRMYKRRGTMPTTIELHTAKLGYSGTTPAGEIDDPLIKRSPSPSASVASLARQMSRASFVNAAAVPGLS